MATGNGSSAGNGTADRLPADALRQVASTGSLTTAPIRILGDREGRAEIVPDEYVRDLQDPEQRMGIFEEMRMADEAVNTGCALREQLLTSGNWVLTAPSDDDRAREILEFVEDNVYPVLGDLLRQLGGGRIQYGFAALEPVYAWSDDPFFTPRRAATGSRPRTGRRRERRIWLKRLAHIRQRTVSAFVVDDREGPTKGELLAIRQWGYSFGRASRYLRTIDVPAEKLILSTYNRQGDDYFGVPPTRHCYRAYKFKQQVEKLNLMNLDRFGVGTPVLEEGQNWTDADRAVADQFMRLWRSGANTFMRHAGGGKITIVTGDGTMLSAAKAWAEFYGLTIAKTYLTQQTELGSTQTGSRAVGDTFFEQLEGVVQADAEEVAQAINERLIVPLVRYNFGPQDAYPLFSPTQRVRATAAVATTVVALKGAGLITWTPSDEVALRDMMGLPEVELADLEALAAEREARAAEIRGRIGASTTEDSTDGDEEDTREEGAGQEGARQNAPPRPARAAARTRAHAAARAGRRARRPDVGRGAGGVGRTLAESYPGQPAAPMGEPASPPPPAVPGTTYRTQEYTAWEATVVRPHLLARDLDLEQARLTAEVQAVLRKIDEDLAADVERIAASGAPALAGSVREIGVPDALRDELREVLLEAARRAREYGANSVLAEIARQAGPADIGPDRAPDLSLLNALTALRSKVIRLQAGSLADLAAEGVTAIEQRELLLEAEVDRVVENEIDRREQSARGAALTALAAAATLNVGAFVAYVVTRAKTALADLSPYRTEDNVAGVVNGGFGAGRADGRDTALAAGEEIRAKVYSAVLDNGTCEECAKWDGAEFPIDYPEDARGVQCPNPKCAGTYARCRCVWVYVLADEVSGAPASKGPVGLD